MSDLIAFERVYIDLSTGGSMSGNYLTFKVQFPDRPPASDNLVRVRQQFVETVELLGGKVTINEVLPAFEDLGIKHWIVDDCDTRATNGAELLMVLGDIADEAGNIFRNTVFEDEHGVIHRVITTYEILQITDPEERADLLSSFSLMQTPGNEQT